MDFSLDNLINRIEMLTDALDQLQSSFDSEWDDEVHDSYEAYVSKCQTATQGIEGILGALEKNCTELNSIQPDQIVQDAESVCAEVNFFRNYE